MKETQHGFRKGKSCCTNLLVLLDRMTRCIDEGGSMIVAFDKVPHKRLIEKLQKHRIGGKLKCVIESWLANRRQRVCVRGVMSGWMKVISRVPQGSVLGALLFLLYINDLDTGLINELLKFADDTKLFGKVTDWSDSESFQEDLNRPVNWADRWKKELNVQKM